MIIFNICGKTVISHILNSNYINDSKHNPEHLMEMKPQLQLFYKNMEL